LKSLAASIGAALLILLLFALFLLDANRIPVMLHNRYPENPFLTTFGRYCGQVRSYFVNTGVIGLAIAAASTVLLVILGVPNPLLWGVALFVLHFVPVIGFWLAVLPLTFTALVANGPQNALIALVGIVVIDTIILNSLYFRLMGTGLNLSPAATFVSLLFWTFLLGPLGALLALPLTVLVKTMILDDDANMIAEMMSYTRGDSSQSPTA